MTDHLLPDEREALRLAGDARGMVTTLIGRVAALRRALRAWATEPGAVCPWCSTEPHHVECEMPGIVEGGDD